MTTYLVVSQTVCFRCLARFDQGPIEEDESVIYLEQEYALTQRVDLKDCIELHTKEEEVYFLSYSIEHLFYETA